jgi:hypothetical protein
VHHRQQDSQENVKVVGVVRFMGTTALRDGETGEEHRVRHRTATPDGRTFRRSNSQQTSLRGSKEFRVSTRGPDDCVDPRRARGSWATGGGASAPSALRRLHAFCDTYTHILTSFMAWDTLSFVEVWFKNPNNNTTHSVEIDLRQRTRMPGEKTVRGMRGEAKCVRSAWKPQYLENEGGHSFVPVRVRGVQQHQHNVKARQQRAGDGGVDRQVGARVVLPLSHTHAKGKVPQKGQGTWAAR